MYQLFKSFAELVESNSLQVPRLGGRPLFCRALNFLYSSLVFECSQLYQILKKKQSVK